MAATKMAQMAGTYQNKWRAEIAELRSLAVEAGLKEERKWFKPCFTLDGKNVAIIIPLKDSVNLNFFQGALLTDPAGLLQKIGQQQAPRWVKFASVAEIAKQKKAVKGFLKEAMAHAKAGTKLERVESDGPVVPVELEKKFKESPELKKAFSALTPGRQRMYLFHFNEAKQAATRESRIEKHIPKILRGEGFSDAGRKAFRAKRAKI